MEGLGLLTTRSDVASCLAHRVLQHDHVDAAFGTLCRVVAVRSIVLACVGAEAGDVTLSVVNPSNRTVLSAIAEMKAVTSIKAAVGVRTLFLAFSISDHVRRAAGRAVGVLDAVRHRAVGHGAALAGCGAIPSTLLRVAQRVTLPVVDIQPRAATRALAEDPQSN